MGSFGYGSGIVQTRRPYGGERSFKAWVQAHREWLLSTQVPLEIFQSEVKWGYFCMHGDEPSTNWSASELSAESLQELRLLLIELEKYEPYASAARQYTEHVLHTRDQILW